MNGFDNLEESGVEEYLLADRYVARKLIPKRGVKVFYIDNEAYEYKLPKTGKKTIILPNGNKHVLSAPKNLTKYQEQFLYSTLLENCINQFAYKLALFNNREEDQNDTRQTGVLLFDWSLGQLDITKIPKYKYSAKSTNARPFKLNNKEFKHKNFKKFVNDYIVKQVPISKLKKEFKEKFELYLAGANEWLARQFISRYHKAIRWHLMENRARTNQARNDRRIQDTPELVNADKIIAENSLGISEESIVLKRFMEKEEMDIFPQWFKNLSPKDRAKFVADHPKSDMARLYKTHKHTLSTTSEDGFEELFVDFLRDVIEEYKANLTCEAVKALQRRYKEKFEEYKVECENLFIEMGHEPPNFDVGPKVRAKKDLIDKDFPETKS